MALILLHQNIQDFAARLREDYRTSERDRTLLLARFIVARVQDGTFTDAQMQAAFAKTSANWTTLKNRMISLISAGNSLLAAVGE